MKESKFEIPSGGKKYIRKSEFFYKDSIPSGIPPKKIISNPRSLFYIVLYCFILFYIAQTEMMLTDRATIQS